jgi:hypothetical protein
VKHTSHTDTKIIKKLKRNKYLSISNHQKNYARYAKDFKLNLTYGKILRKYNLEGSRCDVLCSKEELPRSLVNEKLLFGQNNINIFEKNLQHDFNSSKMTYNIKKCPFKGI